MDETTYSDTKVIDLINQEYVPMRIDSDLRPDINARYNMGGWPTAVFLTAEGDIITGCTYLPPDEFAELLARVGTAYQRDKLAISQRAQSVRGLSNIPAETSAKADESTFDSVLFTVAESFDHQFGGFGREPKFPNAEAVQLLLHAHRIKGDEKYLDMVQSTLVGMVEGELFDHEEGGFYRYATKRDWSAPHYEKILADNLKLVDLYKEAFLVTRDHRYSEVSARTLDYLKVHLYDPKMGLFFGSQDANEDYYLLSLAERRKTSAPAVDPTFYTDVNASAASTLLKTAGAIDRPQEVDLAINVIDQLLAQAEAAPLSHSYTSEGTAGIPALLSDYANMIDALLEAHGRTGSYRYLEAAQRLASNMVADFWDSDDDGFFDTQLSTAAIGRLQERHKPIGANSAAAEALLRLHHLTFNEEYRQMALSALDAFASQAQDLGEAASGYAMAVHRGLYSPIEVTISGNVGSEEMMSLMFATASLPYPNVAMKIDEGPDSVMDHRRDASVQGSAQAIVCLNTLCLAPISDPNILRTTIMEHVAGLSSGGTGEIPVITLMMPPV